MPTQILDKYWLGKYPVTKYNTEVPIYKKVNKDFFKKWTPKMAYVLGFFAADGYITVNKRGGQFWCLDIKDRRLIQKIRITIQAEHKISIRKREGGRYRMYRLQIGSIEMCNDLRKLGFNIRKTKNLLIPNIPHAYFSHFVRGYFDGDGNVWSGYVHKERKTKLFVLRVVFTSCSMEFLDSLMHALERFGVMNGVVSKSGGNYYRLTYSTYNALRLYDFMYNKSIEDFFNLFLNRKKKIFEKFKSLRS